MNYTQWLLKLVRVIVEDADLRVDQIALSEKECRKAWFEGVSPETLYEHIWRKDAASYFAIDF